MRIAIALAALLIAATARGQVSIQGPRHAAPGNLVILRATIPEGAGHKWAVFPESAAGSFLPVVAADGSQAAVFATSTPGVYRFVLAAAVDSDAMLATHELILGDSPGPGPVPPSPPDPPDPPGPTPGKRIALLVHESGDSSPAFSRLVVGLRNGDPAAYLRSKGHELAILDDDSVGPDGRPAPVVESWRPHWEGMRLPVLFVLDASSELIHKVELADSTKPADVINIIKEHGG